MSGVLNARRLAEYRRKIRDPHYLAQALVQVASVLVDMMVLGDCRGWRNGVRAAEPGPDERHDN